VQLLRCLDLDSSFRSSRGGGILIVDDIVHRSTRQIKRAILENEFLGNLEENQVEALVSAMYPKQIPANTLVIQEGDIGTSAL
jgi:phosphopantothenate synthetase